jgi:O-antigen/teichoic acid export membrane protein
MGSYFRRLVTSGAAYQAGRALSGVLALFTLPLYTGHLSKADYGYAETLLTFIILTSILLRMGIGEAVVRFWFDDEDEDRRIEVARTTTAFAAATTTVVSLVALAFAQPLSELLLDTDDAGLMRCGVLGIWAFTNMDIAYALLRVEERRKTFVIVSCSNVLLTVVLTTTLVVFLDQGARGYVIGNYAATAVMLLALWWTLRDRVRLIPRTQHLMAMLAFGAPTVPADAATFALNFLDRAYLLRAESPGAVGAYSAAIKLSSVVIVAVAGFQAAWPPLVYSVTDDKEAAKLYARVTTAYVAFTGLIVVAVTLLGRWAVDVFTAPDYSDAADALPWVALGWSLYGLFLVFVTIAGRMKVTARTFPAAITGLAVNGLLLVLLVPPFGIAGAGIALCGAYAVMLVAMHLLTRNLFAVAFEWGRLTRAVLVLTAIGVGGELLLPTDGVAGFVTRLAAVLLVFPALVAVGVVTRGELRGLVQLRKRAAQA